MRLSRRSGAAPVSSRRSPERGRTTPVASVELSERDRLGAVAVAGGELLCRPDVDQHRLPAREAVAQLVWSDRLDLVAEVVACRTIDGR